MRNRQWLIADRPIGRPVAETDFCWAEGDARAPDAGEVLVRVTHLGFDPAQKGWMENVADYIEPTEIGDVMRADGVGEVVESRDPRFAAGDKVGGLLGWQDFATMAGDALTRIDGERHLTASLGILGLTGMTAYFGLKTIARPFPGDTVLVTGAAGSTGSTVGQIARLAGCRVIGIAGGPDKCQWLTETLGFDAAVDYKAGPVRRQIRALVPGGVDIVWDNVGGPVFDSVLPCIADGARIVICGAISAYSASALPPGPSHYMQLVFRRATMAGFIVWDYRDAFPAARARMAEWLETGQLRHAEDIAYGLEAAPATLKRLFDGRNRGKQILSLHGRPAT